METNSQWDYFTPFFNPNAIVIIGASRNEYTFNGVLVKNLLEAQYKGKIYIVHPYVEELMGIKCLHSISELITLGDNKNLLPVYPSLAIILSPREIVTVIEEIAQLGILNIMIETDLNLGLDPNAKLQLYEQIYQLKKKYQLKIMGPSMIGVIDFQHQFTSSIIPVRSHILYPNPKERAKSGISYLAQSGGLSGACGWWDPPQNIPFAKVIHIGESLGISNSELFAYLLQDPQTEIILLFLKEIESKFIECLKLNPISKPILYKYVGKENPLEIEFQNAGAIRVENYSELFEFAKVFLWSPPITNPSVGIIGPSAGAISLFIAEMRKYNIHIAKLDDENREFILSHIGGSTCKMGNPVDYWPPAEFVGTQICRVYHNASQTLLKDPHVGALFLALEFFTEIEFNFSVFEKIRVKYPNKPIIVVLIQAEREGRERIIRIANELKIPVFIDEVERSVRALNCLLQYHQKRNEKK